MKPGRNLTMCCSKVAVCIHKIVLSDIYCRRQLVWWCQETLLYYVSQLCKPGSLCGIQSTFIYPKCFCASCLLVFILRDTLLQWELIKETFGQCSVVRIEDKNTPRLEMTCGYLHNLRLILSGQARPAQNMAHCTSYGSSVLLIFAENCFANQKQITIFFFF